MRIYVESERDYYGDGAKYVEIEEDKLLDIILDNLTVTSPEYGEIPSEFGLRLLEFLRNNL
jgi:hypothetical protein